ncbi:MAG: FAD-dependent oxidoreductase [Chloroflexi bacterium]|nr:FAD-dependent oxidoreductase [Chloroflexota bacterium]
MTLFPRLFEPGRIGAMELRNRVVMAPLGTFSADNGHASQPIIDYYVERARGEVGLIITQNTAVSFSAPGARSFLALYDDSFIPTSKKMCDAVHQHGAKIGTQLGHHGIQQAEPGRRMGFDDREIPVVAPSAVTYIPTGVVAHELSLQEIKGIQGEFVEAARRARDAGFDTVEVHAANGRLANQFLSPFYNKRTDEYGGSLEKRARFACEIIQGIRQKLGKDYPVLIRLNAEDGFYHGTKIEHAVRFCQLFEEAGADGIDISVGASEFSPYLIPCYLHPDGVFVPLCAAIRKAVNIPVIAVGKIVDPFMAERILTEGKGDFIGLGRGLMADPYWAAKAREGRHKEIVRCIACLNCHGAYAKQRRGMACTVNPALMREREFILKSTSSPKKVMVIGGGIAGMEAARTLAQRGHQVALYEKSDRLGGQWNIVCQQPGKRDFASLTLRLIKGLQGAGVSINLSQEADRSLVEKVKPDVVVVAAGATPATLDIPGANGANVVQATDVILGKAKVGESAAVIGEGALGMEMAFSLAEQGKRVRLITPQRVGAGVEHFLRLSLRERLLDHNVPLHPFSNPLEITPEGVAFVTSYPTAEVDSYVNQTQTLQNEFIFVKADTVVLAIGGKAENRLAAELKPLVPELHIIGDCVAPRDALAAMEEGAEVGRGI